MRLEAPDDISYQWASHVRKIVLGTARLIPICTTLSWGWVAGQYDSVWISSPPFLRHVLPSLFTESLAGLYHFNLERLWEIQDALQRIGTLVFCLLLPTVSNFGRCIEEESSHVLEQVPSSSGTLSLKNHDTTGDFSLLYKSFLLPEFNKYTVGKTNHVLGGLKFPIVPPTPYDR